jgi:hypothetical protein
VSLSLKFKMVIEPYDLTFITERVDDTKRWEKKELKNC